MKLRYLLGKMNQDASQIEIEEAVELVEIYSEEQALRFCPFTNLM